MSLTSQISALATRIGQEVKALYQALSGKEPSIAKSTGYLRYTGTVWEFKNETYLKAITKSMVEAVLTGSITSHNHAGTYEPAISKTDAGFAYWTGTKWLMLPDDFFLTEVPDGSITYTKLAPEMTQRVVTAGNIDWNDGSIFTCTLTTATTFNHYNLKLNKVLTLLMTGDFTFTMPAYCKRISGSYDGSTVNYFQFHCTNNASGSEEVWYTISKQAA